MNSASLKPLQMIGRVVVGQRHHREQLRLRARFEAEPVFAAEVEDFLDDLALLVHLDRVDADVAAFVLVLVDGGLKGVVDVADPVPQDVSKPDQHRQADAAQHADDRSSCLRSMALAGSFVGCTSTWPSDGDREVALAPAIDFVEVGGVVDGEELACLPGSVPSRRGSAHAFIMHTFFHDGRVIGQKRGRTRATERTGIDRDRLVERLGRGLSRVRGSWVRGRVRGSRFEGSGSRFIVGFKVQGARPDGTNPEPRTTNQTSNPEPVCLR